MDFNKRISNIKEYFLTFNISDGAAYAIVKFPTEKWIVPEKKILKEKFKIEVAFQNGVWYFMTEMENGNDCIFDAIDYTIAFNREAMERATMLKAKIDELKVLFTKESIEKLKLLEFTFPKTKKKNVKKETESLKEEDVNKVETTETVEETKEEVKEEQVNDSSLMSFANTMTAE